MVHVTAIECHLIAIMLRSGIHENDLQVIKSQVVANCIQISREIGVDSVGMNQCVVFHLSVKVRNPAVTFGM